jgi:predicted nucleic-acid-binding Zn-ribbon protein
MNEKEKKEIEYQIEKEREEHERDFFNLSKIEKCPKCGGEFDEGYIVMTASNWGEDRFGRVYLGLKKPLTNPGSLGGINPSQFPALRCKKCHFVTFDYTREVERGTVKE